MEQNNDHIFFDLDGVLVSNKFFTTYYLDKVDEKLQQNNIKINRSDLLRRIFNLFNKMLISDKKEERVRAFDWDELIRIIFKKYDLQWENTIEKFYESSKLKNYVRLYADVKKNLDWLKDKYKMALISNGLSKYQYQVLKILKIEKYFSSIILPDHINEIKPHVEIFDHAISLCKLENKDNYEKHPYIGDSIYFDIFGANIGGFYSILISRKLSRKMKKLSIEERTKEFNKEENLKKYIRKDVLTSRFDLSNQDLNMLKPKKVICSLDELKLLF
ncbi:MAG: HAD family hydrolase [Promethearchaeota archaeon]|nr:MAG: HAD family hydrolase [Candidatus Lokiarchaeota archaeon]